MKRWQTRTVAAFGIAAAWTAIRASGDSTAKDRDVPGRPLFREASAEIGLRFGHFTGATGEYYSPENMGPGIALFDYDNDGDLDVFCPQGMLLDNHKALKDALFPLPEAGTPRSRLFRNNLAETGRLSFTDVTQQSGVGVQLYGMGVTTGDYDNDGYADLLITGAGTNRLFHNNRNGTFTDVTTAAGVDDKHWSTSATFFDYNRDGFVDLFVVEYVDFSTTANKVCRSPLGVRDYCNPAVYGPMSARLYRNDRNGRFADVTEAAGIGGSPGRGLGVATGDFNNDGWLDLFVANDGTPSHLWMNQRNGTFSEAGLSSGVAYNNDGKAQAGMGAAVADFDNDGDEDIFSTHLSTEMHTLWVNDGHANFTDLTAAFGLARVRTYTGFGAGWFDYDNDGKLDLFIANGAVYIIESQRGKTPYPYLETNQLFHNDGGGHLTEVTAQAGPALREPGVGRGVAFGDIDNDGDVDIVVANNNGPLRVLLNEAGSRRHWLEVRLAGLSSNRMGLGARVALLRNGEKTLWRRCHSDGSYLSASDSRVHFGLGSNANIQAVGVEWPGGDRELWYRLPADRITTLREGTGTPWHAAAGSGGPRP